MVSSLAVGNALDAQTECRHHWVIGSAGGPTSWGTCERCAARREFRTSLRSSSTYPLWWEKLSPLRIVSSAELEQAEVEAC